MKQYTFTQPNNLTLTIFIATKMFIHEYKAKSKPVLLKKYLVAAAALILSLILSILII